MNTELTINENEYRLTASGAGKVLDGLTAAGVVSLANRGQLPCIRDSSNRRLFAVKDLRALLEKRRAARGTRA